MGLVRRDRTMLAIVYRTKKKLAFFVILLAATITYWYIISQKYSSSQIFYHKLAVRLAPNDFFQLHLYPNQSEAQRLTCQLPRLQFTGHTNHVAHKPCKMEMDWGELQDGRWRLNLAALEPFLDKIRCEYRNLTRLTDFQIKYSANASLVNNQIIGAEVIEVFCFLKGRLAYENIHAQIVDKLDELFPASSPPSKTTTDNSGEACQPMNILLLSYDSLSRVSWLKRLPRTSEFILNEMNFTLLYGQNIMGDGTPACMVPLLTGRAEAELPSTLKSDPKGQFVDQVYPFIWNDLHKKGYVSFHQEDWPQVTTFTYRMRGMSNRTAHHYMRAYQMGLWRRVSSNYYARRDDLCVGSVKRHAKALGLLDQFLEVYHGRARNLLAIIHYLDNTHDGNERAHLVDTDLHSFLAANFAAGRFNNTAVFLFSDHGSRFAEERLTAQGDIEERSPFFSIYLPESYKRAHPDKVKNLERNSQQLSTCFDIHETVRDLTCSRQQQPSPVTSNPPKTASSVRKKVNRAMSLLDPIPSSRSCEDIGIAMHYCTCELEWHRMNVAEERAVKAVMFVIDLINNEMIALAVKYCYLLRLYELTSVEQSWHNEAAFFRIKFVTMPNKGMYEALVKYDSKSERFSITSKTSISRVNAYGTQPQCLDYLPPSPELAAYDLRKYCLCRHNRVRVKFI